MIDTLSVCSHISFELLLSPEQNIHPSDIASQILGGNEVDGKYDVSDEKEISLCKPLLNPLSLCIKLLIVRFTSEARAVSMVLIHAPRSPKAEPNSCNSMASTSRCPVMQGEMRRERQRETDGQTGDQCGPHKKVYCLYIITLCGHGRREQVPLLSSVSASFSDGGRSMMSPIDKHLALTLQC